MTDYNLYLSFLHSIGLSQARLKRVVQGGFDPQQVFKSLKQYFDPLGITTSTQQKILGLLAAFDEDKQRHVLNKGGISLTHLGEESYPRLLSQIHAPPALLYYQGATPNWDACISVVGSRKYSQYSKLALEKILPEMLDVGYCIVSGGAFGLDSVAHEIALVNKGITCVVLGSGIDMWYPRSGIKLFEKVIHEGGTLLSQFPVGTRAEPFHFPMRNEVVAGISQAVLVGQAGRGSGTLITARLALEQNRDVFVIPSDITHSGGEGGNELIRDGLGKLVLSAQDILSEYGYSSENKQQKTIPEFTNPSLKKVYEILLRGPQSFDDLQSQNGFSPQEIQILLSILEVENHVIRDQAGNYGIKA